MINQRIRVVSGKFFKSLFVCCELSLILYVQIVCLGIGLIIYDMPFALPGIDYVHTAVPYLIIFLVTQRKFTEDFLSSKKLFQDILRDAALLGETSA